MNGPAAMTPLHATPIAWDFNPHQWIKEGSGVLMQWTEIVGENAHPENVRRRAEFRAMTLPGYRLAWYRETMIYSRTLTSTLHCERLYTPENMGPVDSAFRHPENG